MIQLIFESLPFTVPNTHCSLDFIRLKSLVGFRKSGAPDYALAEGILDTGAYVTVLPKSFGAELALEEVGRYMLSGINRKAECTMPVKVAYADCVLFDSRGKRSSELRIPCYVSESEDVDVVILGFAGLLTQFELHLDPRRKQAHLKE